MKLLSHKSFSQQIWKNHICHSLDRNMVSISTIYAYCSGYDNL